MRTRSSVLQRARDGDFTELARLYAPLVFQMARKLHLDENDARDVMQETMLELMRLLPRFEYDRQKGTFKGLLKRMVRLRTTDLLRQRNRVKLDEDPGQHQGPDDPFEVLFEREWMHARLQTALDRVRKEVQTSTFRSFEGLVLRGLPMEKVCKQLGQKPNQASQNKRRVIQRLRAHLEDFLDEDE